MRLFLMRHGQTPWNRRQRRQGASDVPLSAAGRRQAAGLVAALAGEPLAAVYASPLGRALETARAVAAPHHLPVVTHPHLRELHHGACEGLTPAELRARFAPVLAAWRAAPADVVLPGGGESMRQVVEVPPERAAALDPSTAVGAAAAGRVRADEAEADRQRVAGTPTALDGRRVRTGAALAALGRRALRRAAWPAASLAGLALGASVASGCSSTGLFAGLSPRPAVSVETSEAFAEAAVVRVAVFDFVPLAGGPADGAFVADELRAALQGRPELSVATPAETSAALEAAGVALPVLGGLPPGMLRAVARELGADAILTGRLNRFRERDGSALAARSGASVDFVMELRRAEDGLVLWRGEYDQTQEALSENLAEAGTFFRSGGRWLAARELAQLGVPELLRLLPLPHRPEPPKPAASPPA